MLKTNSEPLPKRVQIDRFVQKYLSPRKIGMVVWALIRTILILGLAYFILYPLLVKIALAFMDKKDLYDVTVSLLPKTFSMDNMKTVYEGMKYPTAFMHSLVLSVMVTALQVTSCTLIGYGLAKFQFPGRNVLFMLVILTLLVPPQTIIAPIFIQFRYFDPLGLFTLFTGKSVNLIDTYWPFILNSITGMGLKAGLYIYIIRQFFRGMPKELEEAAYVDGAGIFKTFYKISLPGAIPVLTTVILFSFVWQWNDIFYVGWFFDTVKVLPMSLESLASNVFQMKTQETGSALTQDPAYVMLLNSTGTLFVIAPLIILYMFSQKYFVESIERSGIVG